MNFLRGKIDRSFFIALGIALGGYIAVHFVFAPIIDPTIRLGIFTVGVIGGAAGGGYWLGRQWGWQPYLLGAAVGLIQAGALALVGQLPFGVGGLAAALIGSLAGVWEAQRAPFSVKGTVFAPKADGLRDSSLRSARSTRTSGNHYSGSFGRPIQSRHWYSTWLTRWQDRQSRGAYQELLRRVRMDPGTADRLMELERHRAPTATRAELIQRALERLDRDNHF